jgi:hypothetical protein
VKRQQIPVLEQAGTVLTADEVLVLIGDDPETLILAIRLLERMRVNRRSRRETRRDARTY